MIEKIFRLLYDYSKKKKIADEVFIEKVIEIVCEERTLLVSVDFTSDKENALAFYRASSKTIFFNIKNTVLALDKWRVYDRSLVGEQKYFYYNSFILALCLHELEHAYQRKLQMGKSDNLIYARIIKETYKNLDINAYLDIYIYVPTERTAEIKSWETILKCLEHLKDNDILFRIIGCSYLKNCLLGYGVKPPCAKFFDRVGNKEFYSELESSITKDDISSRLLYGLSLNDNKISYLNTLLENEEECLSRRKRIG